MNPINVLICDDSALMRRSLKTIIEQGSGIKVIGAARDGKDAIIKARELKPDVITMDINMPEMDGISALQIIADEGIAPVIMVSSLTQAGAEATFQALALGAFDYISKPGGTVSIRMEPVAKDLIDKIRAAVKQGTLKRLIRRRERRESPYGQGAGKAKVQGRTADQRENEPQRPATFGSSIDRLGYKAVALGVSTGGPKSLFDVLPLLPKDLNAAVFLVQHMPAQFITTFAKRLNDSCAMTCVEAQPGMDVEPGIIYLGKGGYHLTPFKRLSSKITIRTPGKPEHTFIPSVDVMMNSVLEIFGNQTIGVLMTGMGDDGANGMAAIRKAGGFTIAESEESAIVFGMPQEAIKRGGADIITPCWSIAEEIVRAVNRNIRPVSVRT